MRISLYELAILLLGSASSFVYGIDYGYLGGVLAVPGFIEKYGTLDPSNGTYHLKSDRLSLISSTVYLGSLAGAIIAPYLSLHIGKKYGLMLGCVLFALAGALQLGATNVNMFILGRCIAGIHISFANVMGTSFINEVAPKRLRGFGVVLCLQLVTFGNFSSSLVTLGSTSRTTALAYQIPISLCIIVGGAVGLLLFFMPQTPLYYAEKGRWEAAKNQLAKLRRKSVDDFEVREEFEELVQNLEGSKDSASWAELFNKENRFRTMLSTGTLFCMNGLTGVNFFLGYAAVFMSQAGLSNPWAITVLIAGTNCFTTIPALWLIERLGRRTLMWIGCVGCILCNLASGINYSVGHGSKISQDLLVVFTTLYVFAFAAFIGPAGWSFSAEIPSQRLRSKTIGFANVISTIIVWIVGYCSPYIFQDPVNMRAGFAYVWTGGCVLAGLFWYFFLFETSGLSHGEIDALLASGTPARQSAAWVKMTIATRHTELTDVVSPSYSEGDVKEDEKVGGARAVLPVL